MMLAPASFLELNPRSPSGLILRFYSVIDQVLNSELLSLCSAWLWYRVKPRPAVVITSPVVPPTQRTQFRNVSPFFVSTPLVSHRAGVLSITLPQPPSSPVLLQLQQKRPERVPKAHQAAQLPPFLSHQSSRRKGGDFCNSRALQAVFSSSIAK